MEFQGKSGSSLQVHEAQIGSLTNNRVVLNTQETDDKRPQTKSTKNAVEQKMKGMTKDQKKICTRRQSLQLQESNISLRDSVTEEVRLFKAAKVNKRKQWKERIKDLLNTTAWDAFFLILTFYALYAVDLNVGD